MIEVPASPAPAAAPRRGPGRLSWLTGNLWVRFLVRRLVSLIVVLVFLVVGVFFMVHLVPGDPVRAGAGAEPPGRGVLAPAGTGRPRTVQLLRLLAAEARCFPLPFLALQLLLMAGGLLLHLVAVETAREVAELRPGDFRAWLALVRTLQGRETNEEALEALDKALALNPRAIEA